jgi:hypothetical protein
MSRKAIPALTAGLLFAVVSTFGQMPAANTYASSSWLPPIGFGSSETVQVNIVNSASVPANATAPQTCTASIAFYNASGTIVGAATSFTLVSGQIFSASLPYGSSGASGSRTLVQAKITVTGSARVSAVGGPSFTPCVVASSLESYDTATGVTHVFVPGAAQVALPVIRTGVFTPENP